MRRFSGNFPSQIPAKGRPEVLAMWREAMKPEAGRNQHSGVDNVNAPKTEKGKQPGLRGLPPKSQRPDLFEQLADTLAKRWKKDVSQQWVCCRLRFGKFIQFFMTDS